MTQQEFNTEIAFLLDDICEQKFGMKRSEPKHGIVGDELRDRAYKLFSAAYNGEVK